MDYTRLQTFRNCPTRYKLHYDADGQGHGLKLVEDTVGLPLVFGQKLHKGLDQHYQGLPQSLDLDVLDTYNDPCRNQRNLLTTLMEYKKFWTTLDAEYKVLEVETVHRFDIGASEPWEVKYDAILEHPTNGIFSLETKHTAKKGGFSQEYWRSYEPNTQVSGQVAGIIEKYGQCSGVLVNGIWIGFNQKAGSRHPAGFWVEFQRQLFTRTADQLEDFKRQAALSIKRLRSTTDWEKNEAQCTYCPYRAHCMSCGDKSIEATLYELVEEPCAYLKEEETK